MKRNQSRLAAALILQHPSAAVPLTLSAQLLNAELLLPPSWALGTALEWAYEQRQGGQVEDRGGKKAL